MKSSSTPSQKSTQRWRFTTADAERYIFLGRREKAKKSFAEYIKYIDPSFIHGYFTRTVCQALDQFLADTQAGDRPILILQAPPQHGKSQMVSRLFPAYLMGRDPEIRIGAASYADSLAMTMAQDVRRNISSDRQRDIFPVQEPRRDRYAVDRAGEFTAHGGRGSYLGVGVGAGLTGRPVDIGIIDDPVKNAQESLSETTKSGHWDWYQTVFKTRLSQKSGHIIMATSWAADDLAGRIAEQHQGDPRLRILRFPAINMPGESGYEPAHPLGALAPALHPIEQLIEIKKEMSTYWWSALYQQSPRPVGGNIFLDSGKRLYLTKDLPRDYDKIIASWDCTFKDTDGTDFVVGQVWGKKGANSYLLDQTRARLSFTATVAAVVAQRVKWPRIREILIEDKANGPAVIDILKTAVPGIIPVEPDGSKLARAHAVTSFWEAGNVRLPHPDLFQWATALLDEIAFFPAGSHDDQVDAMTQALRRLYPAFSRLKISAKALDLVSR